MYICVLCISISDMCNEAPVGKWRSPWVHYDVWQ